MAKWQRQLSGRAKGSIAGVALLTGILSGGLYGSTEKPAPASTASGCAANHFSYGHNMMPCSTNGAALRRTAGRTLTGCVVGAVGGPEGIFPGCVGGLASNIAW